VAGLAIDVAKGESAPSARRAARQGEDTTLGRHKRI
jgi:hypothetical protein